MNSEKPSNKLFITSDLHRNLRDIFEKQFRKQFKVFFTLLVIAVAASVLRSVTDGWKPIYYLHISVLLIISVFSALSRNLKGFYYGGMVIGLLFIVSLGNLLNLGLVSQGMLLMLLSVISITLFFGKKTGFTVTAVNLVFIVFVGYLYVRNIIPVHDDTAEYVKSMRGWTAQGTGFLLFAFYAVITIDVVQSHLFRLISNIHRKELELGKKDLRYNAMLQNIPGVVYHCLNDEHMTMKFISEEIENLSGYAAGEFIANSIRSFADIIHNDDRSKVSKTVAQALEKDEPFTIEYRIVDRENIFHWVREKGRGSVNEDDGEIHRDGVIVNITDEKAMEYTLRENEKRFRTIVEDAMGILLILSPDYKILEFNPEAERVFGYTREEVLGKNYLELCLPEEVRGDAAGAIRGILNGNPVRGFENEVLIADGSRRTVIWNSSSLHDKDNKPIGVIVAGQDITDRRQFEERLRKSELQYRSLFEGANDAIFILSDNLFLDCNSKVLSLFGCKREQIVGADPIQFSPELQPDGRRSEEVAREKMETALRTGSQRFEWTHCKLDKTEIQTEVSISRIDIAESPLLLAIVHDITDRKILESELRQSRANLQAVLESTTDLVWSVDRDLKIMTYNSSLADHLRRVYGSEIETGCSSENLAPPKKTEFLSNMYRRVLAEGACELEYDIPETGQHMDMFMFPIIVEGSTIGVAVFGKDISDRKKLESELLQSQANLKAVLESTTDLVWSVDREFMIMTYNSSLAKHLKRTYGTEIEAGCFSEILVPPDKAAFWTGMYKRVLTEGATQMEYDISDSGRCMEISLFPVVSEGKAVGVSVFSKDITDRKRVERELLEEKAVTDAIINTMPGVFFLYGQEGVLTRWNRNLEILTGFTGEDGMKLNVADYFEPETARRVEKAIEEVEASGSVSMEVGVKNRSAVVIPYLFNIETISLKGKLFLLGVGTDISGIKKAEAAIRESEKRYRILFESSGDAIFILDDGKVFDCNKKALQMFGFTENEIMGVTPVDNSPERQPNGVDSGAKAAAVMKDAVNGNMQFFEWQFRRKDGSEFYTEVILNRIELNNKIYLQCIVRDITERKRVEKELVEEKAFSDAIINTLPGTFFMFDDGMRLIRWNDNLQVLEGRDGDEMVQKGLLDNFDEKSRKKIIRMVKQTMKSGAGVIEAERVHPDGSGGAYLYSAVKLSINGSDYVIGTGNDITELKKAQESIRESEERFQQIANNIEEVFFLVDKLNKSFLYISPVLEDIFGIPAEKIYSDFFILFNFIHPDDRKDVRISDLSMWYDIPINETFRIIRPDGIVRWVRLRSFLIYDNDGEVYRIAGVIADVTESVQAQEASRLHQQQLIQADKMASVGMMVSGVAHEINNPNNLIMLNADVMNTIWQPASELLTEFIEKRNIEMIASLPASKAIEKFGTLIEGISGGAVRIKRIVQNLKDFARLDTGEINESLHINNVIETALQIVFPIIKKATKSFSVEYGKNIPNLNGNHQKLEQVFINLITNACQSLENNEKAVSVHTEYIVSDKVIKLSVSDEGKGISSEHLDKIFDPFFTTKRDSGGTGLGMSVSYGIVKEHKGEIVIQSTLGVGTTVTVLFPAKM